MKYAHEWVRYAILGLMLGAGLGDAAAASAADGQAEDAVKAQALAQPRQQMVEACMRNRGTREDCEKQVDAELAAEGVDRQNTQSDQGRRRPR